MTTLSRIQTLEREILAANHDYHGLAESRLSDIEYDRLVKELRELSPESTVLTQIGEKPKSSSKMKHKRKMLSLDNVFNPMELKNFFKSVPKAKLIGEPKIDGLSLSLHYSQGLLQYAVTRGDGTEGDLVTENARQVRGIPPRIKYQGEIEFRGETFISKKDFDEMVKQMIVDGEEPFSNARNAAAGSMKLKDVQESSKRNLQFICYQVFRVEPFESQSKMYDFIDEQGFVRSQSSEPIPVWDLVERAEIFDANGMRDELPYEVDGIVFKIDDCKLQQELGVGNRAPKWAVAYKFPPEEKLTELLDVSWQVGRTGVLTPVAHLASISLAGAIVQRASLCNVDEINRLDIQLHDEVIAIRAAEVIPKVIGRKPGDHPANAKPILIPTICPCCKKPVVKDPDYVALRCVNYGCEDQVKERIRHAVAKTSLDWDGCGSAQINELVQDGCESLSDLISLTDITWMKPAAQKKFAAERERVKSAPFWRKLHALGIEKIGKTFCQELALRYANILEIADDRAGVLAIVGPNRGEIFFRELERLLPEIGKLDELGYAFQREETQTAKTEATGKTFVITGTLVTGGRDQVSQKVEQAGGVVKSSVGKTTDYLVVGESPGANKTKAAQKHSTRIITEEDLYALLGLDYAAAASGNVLNGISVEDL